MTRQGPVKATLDRPLRFELEVPNDAVAIGVVRRAATFAAEICGDETAGVVGLVLTELVTNAIVHSRIGPDDRISVRLTISADGIRGEVSDPGIGFEPTDEPQPSTEGGFGLFIVQRLASSWGVDRVGGATCVWFQL